MATGTRTIVNFNPLDEMTTSEFVGEIDVLMAAKEDLGQVSQRDSDQPSKSCHVHFEVCSHCLFDYSEYVEVRGSRIFSP